MTVPTAKLGTKNTCSTAPDLGDLHCEKLPVSNTHIHHPHSDKEILHGELVVMITVELPEEVDNSGMIGPQPLKHSAQKMQKQLLCLS